MGATNYLKHILDYIGFFSSRVGSICLGCKSMRGLLCSYLFSRKIFFFFWCQVKESLVFFSFMCGCLLESPFWGGPKIAVLSPELSPLPWSPKWKLMRVGRWLRDKRQLKCLPLPPPLSLCSGLGMFINLLKGKYIFCTKLYI